MWSHGVVHVERLLCEVMCLGVRDGAAETLLTGVKVVPETTYLGKYLQYYLYRSPSCGGRNADETYNIINTNKHR